MARKKKRTQSKQQANAKRLRDVIDSAEALGTMIHENGDNYSGAVEWLKRTMGIDLEAKNEQG